MTITIRPVAAAVVAALLLALLSLTPSGAEAMTTVSVTPDTDVVDGDTVTVRAAGLPPGQLAGVGQCASEVLVDNDFLTHCDLSNTGGGIVRPNGTIRVEHTVYRFLSGRDGPLDCAVPGTCVLGVAVLDPLPVSDTIAATEIGFDDSVVNDPPLELGLTVDRVDARSVDVTVSCNVPAEVNLSGRILQDRGAFPIAELQGRRTIACDGEVSATVLVVPEQLNQRGTLFFPFRRLRAGPADLQAGAFGRSARWTDDQLVETSFVVDQPDLDRRRSQPDEVSARLAGLRVTEAGRGLARIEVTCPRPIDDVVVEVDVVAPAPGAAYRRATALGVIDRCEGTTTIRLELNRLDRFSFAHRVDIVRAGPAEAYVTAKSRVGFGEAIDMRPLTLRRDIVPEVLRVRHRSNSRIRIGPTSADQVRLSFRCGRTAPFTVVVAAGQRRGDIVRTGGGSRWIDCVEGRTVVFDVELQGVAAERRTAITALAVNGHHFAWAGPWQQTQQGWRTTS